MNNMSLDESTRPLTIIIERKSWKFYAGILIGVTVASAGFSFFALNHRYQSSLQSIYRTNRKFNILTPLLEKQNAQEDMYEMMTDELISLMNAEVK